MMPDPYFHTVWAKDGKIVSRSKTTLGKDTAVASGRKTKCAPNYVWYSQVPYSNTPMTIPHSGATATSSGNFQFETP